MSMLPYASVALGLFAYALYEPYRYRLVTQRIPVGPRAPRLRILHVSDTHISGRNRSLPGWLQGLPAELGGEPDLVLATGDFIKGNEGIRPTVEALSGLRARLGRFYVLGSHDYFIGEFEAYTKYFTGRGRRVHAVRAATDDLEGGLRAAGWEPLTNATRVLDSPEGTIRLVGVDDPYLERHRTDHIRRSPDDVLAIGLMHTPDVVSEWALAGFDLVVAGHTHGGQVRFPFVGALVTNCSLPAGLARGPHRVGGTWLHVSPGLGTGRFTPIRFGCRPEATLLTLEPGGGEGRA